MPIAGSLADYAIADVLQLLHASRRTGTLNVHGPEGQSAVLSLRDGALVGAQHPSRAVHVGSILLELEALDLMALEHGLRTQAESGEAREPLIATLVRMGLIERATGYRALVQLIEETVLEVVGWKSGSFELVDREATGDDEFRHVPELLGEPVSVDAQGAIVGALRILGGEGPRQVAGDDAAARAGALELQLANVRQQLAALKARVRELREQQGGSSEISAAMLRHVAQSFDRCVLFLARRVDVLGLGALGLGGDDALSSAVLKLKVPFDEGSQLHTAVTAGTLVAGTSDDPALREHLYPRIGAPAFPSIVLLPLRAGPKTAALIYADFGAREPAPVETDALEILAEHAGLALELALQRARMGKA